MALKGQLSKFKPEMCDKVVELMKQGASKYEIALELDICEDTFYEYIKVHPDFSEAVKRGEYLSRGWWEKQGRTQLLTKEFNSTLWYMNMKNRHGWKDRQESEYNVNVKQENSIKDLE